MRTQTVVTSHEVNGLVIVESLDPSSFKTGESLCEKLTTYCQREAIFLGYFSINTRAEFAKVLRILEREVISGTQFRPILHIEAHGADDGQGLVLANGDMVRWPDFALACRRINEATQNNLMVVFAACYGYSAVCGLDLSKVSPYCSLVGPTTTVTTREIAASFDDFYTELFASGDFEKASSSLPKGYEIYSCERMFVKAWQRYLTMFCSAKARAARGESVLTRGRVHSPMLPLKQARKRIRAQLQPTEAQCAKLHSQFLMSELPCNLGRFSDSLAIANGLIPLREED